jgi:hypothetical protein
MPNGSVISRVTRASLEDIQGQFEALAPKFSNLHHFYAVHLGDEDLPFPARVRDASQGHFALGASMSGYTILVHGRWVNLRTIGPGPVKVWQSWFKGDGQSEFHALAERAGPQLSAFRVRLPAPRECSEILKRDSGLPEGTLVLPDEIHRWPKVLHWLGWAGKVMPVERWATFNGIEMPFDTWDESRFGSRPQAFYSIVDNLFLRSAAALEWMIANLGETDVGAGTLDRTDPLQEPSTDIPAKRNAERLKPSQLKAYSQWTWAIQQNQELCDKTADRQVYDWLHENGEEGDLPPFDNWSRYLREVRKARGESKNAPRSGRTSRNVIGRE